jgi:uncharacterized protein YjbJ (UPF0337 family)
MIFNMKDNSGKIILALVAGASAGLIAGLLMAPETGENTRGSIKNSAGKLGKDLEKRLKDTLDKLSSLNIPGLGTMGNNKLMMKGDWNETKGKLKQRFGQLTDDDLTYAEGGEDELVGNLQRALGKTKQEVTDMLSSL